MVQEGQAQDHLRTPASPRSVVPARELRHPIAGRRVGEVDERAGGSTPFTARRGASGRNRRRPCGSGRSQRGELPRGRACDPGVVAVVAAEIPHEKRRRPHEATASADEVALRSRRRRRCSCSPAPRYPDHVEASVVGARNRGSHEVRQDWVTVAATTRWSKPASFGSPSTCRCAPAPRVGAPEPPVQEDMTPARLGAVRITVSPAGPGGRLAGRDARRCFSSQPWLERYAPLKGLEKQWIQVERAELAVAGPRLCGAGALEGCDVDEDRLRSAPLDVVGTTRP